MAKGWLKLYFAIFVLFLSASPIARATPVSGDVRGVTFFYLDGVAQDFPWVLDNQTDPNVTLKLTNLFSQYKRSGVNWVRLLVAGDHRPEWRQPPSSQTVAKLNAFLGILNRNGLTAEIVLVPPTTGGLFDATNAFATSKAWFSGWIQQINYTNVGMIMLGGDLSPCWLSGCEGSSTAEALPRNHGAFVREIWKWKQATYPKLNASYEVIGIQDQSNNDPRLIGMLAKWADANTPSLQTLGASLYVALPAGTPWTGYANAVDAVLKSYHAATTRPLWIDEYGAGYRSSDPANVRTEADQKAAYDGLLGATVCWNQKRYAKFAWVAGRDYPYNGKESYQLVKAFLLSGIPQFTSAWATVGQYYNLESCP
ncbi:hypothetical protein [Niveibacterium sp. COAC-50]|uniref:hypothetical protein n=1 Tax=Niveibacterium sp. COAC-50 TaxID=2729384 RepID=UPI00155235DB|nr:hypothetical protein [Niveibacterium sp. COAC-50]